MSATDRPDRSKRLIERQLRKAGLLDRNDANLDHLRDLVEESYREFDRHRELNDRSNRLASEELAETIASLDASERLFRSLTRSSPNGVIFSDSEGACLYANERAELLFGPKDDLMGRSWLNWVLDDDRSVVHGMLEDMRTGVVEDILVEHRIKQPSGTVVWVSTSASVVVDPEHNDKVTGWVALFEDITDRKRYEHQLATLARNDSLTQLNNRYSLGEQLGQMCEALHDDERVAVAVIDLDRFKMVNDTFGHDAGDQLLVTVARKLEGARRSGDIVARLGGDEFAFVCALDGKQDVAEVADRLSSAIHGPVDIGGRTLHMAGSVGLAVARAGELSPEELLRNADTAMYRAKRSSIVSAEIFNESFREEAVHQFELESDVRQAVDGETIELAYQPIIDGRTGRIVAIEALARLHHPDVGSVPPLEFIKVAEELGLIHELGEQLLHRACAQMSEWRRAITSLDEVAISVNTSPLQLRDPEFPTLIRRLLSEHDLPASCLMIEFTEDVLGDDQDPALETLDVLRALGVQLALDDFGAGASSLLALERVQADYLKISQTFVSELGADGSGRSRQLLIDVIIDLARRFRMTPIAEGIETEAQRHVLMQSGCDILQGHFVGRPLPAGDPRLPGLLAAQIASSVAP